MGESDLTCYSEFVQDGSMLWLTETFERSRTITVNVRHNCVVFCYVQSIRKKDYYGLVQHPNLYKFLIFPQF